MPEAHVELFIDFTGLGVETEAEIYRGLSATGPWTLINTVPLLGEQAVYIDSTAPLDTPVWYRIIGHPGATEDIQGPFEVPSLGQVWIKDPLRPWASQAFDVCENGASIPNACGPADPVYLWLGFQEQNWDMDAGLFPVLNAEHPADVYARRKFATGALRFITRSLAAADTIYELFTAGGPVFVQAPPVYGWDDAHVQPGPISWEYIHPDQRIPDRIYTVPWTIVDAVEGPAQGTLCANWCAVEEAFATFADMTAAGGTWQDVAEGTTACPPTEPPVPDGFGMGEFGAGPFGDGG